MMKAVDEAIRSRLRGFRWERLAEVDRAVLRIVVCEHRSHPEIAKEILISEAVGLAERYGGEESPRFVNGLLSKLFESENRGKTKP